LVIRGGAGQAKAVGYPARIDKLLGVPGATRNCNTIMAVAPVLSGNGKKGR
jgi:hypothetical protein